MIATEYLQNPFRRPLVVGVAALFLLLAATVLWAGSKQEDKIGVGLTGVHHLGRDYNISEFRVNGYSGMNVGRGGGGGSNVCCVVIPRKWSAGLTVEVIWSINDWSHEDREEIKAGNYESLAFGGAYRAIVPVEKYDEPGRMYVHFFPGGRVRVVSSNIGPGGMGHPIADNDQRAATLAISGTPVSTDIFEDQEYFKDWEERARRGEPL